MPKSSHFRGRLNTVTNELVKPQRGRSKKNMLLAVNIIIMRQSHLCSMPLNYEAKRKKDGYDKTILSTTCLIRFQLLTRVVKTNLIRKNKKQTFGFTSTLRSSENVHQTQVSASETVEPYYLAQTTLAKYIKMQIKTYPHCL